MPKETISPDIANRSGHTPTSADFNIAVTWGKEGGEVKIATVNPDGKLAIPVNKGGVEGHDILNVIDPGWFVALDRNGINHLIRTLRKARDQSFGRDE